MANYQLKVDRAQTIKTQNFHHSAGRKSRVSVPKEPDTMRMTIERTGGFAGLTTTKVVDTTTLSADEANQLRQLVDAANLFRLPATITANSPQPDRFQYQLTVEDDGKQHTVKVSEQAIPGTLRPLIEWITAAVRN